VNDDELNSLISKSKIGICASLDEGFGLPLREFLSSGLLVVASDIPAFREVSSKNVSYFELSNLDSLDRAVRKSLNTTFSPEAHPTRAWSEVFVEVKNFINSL
jgi:glycosyltransferase involved in cell wall biosynthesis